MTHAVQGPRRHQQPLGVQGGGEPLAHVTTASVTCYNRKCDMRQQQVWCSPGIILAHSAPVLLQQRVHVLQEPATISILQHQVEVTGIVIQNDILQLDDVVVVQDIVVAQPACQIQARCDIGDKRWPGVLQTVQHQCC